MKKILDHAPRGGRLLSTAFKRSASLILTLNGYKLIELIKRSVEE